MDFKSRLNQNVKILDFRIFGSYAKGEADKYSDLDVFVELPEVNEEIKSKIRELAWEVGFANDIVISPLIFSKDEIENTPMRSSNIVKTIMRDGVQI